MAYDYSDFDEQPSMSPELGQRLYNRHQDAVRSRSAEFAAGHDSAKPDRPLSGNYSPPKEQWDKEALRTVEMERMHQLTSDKDY